MLNTYEVANARTQLLMVAGWRLSPGIEENRIGPLRVGQEIAAVAIARNAIFMFADAPSTTR